MKYRFHGFTILVFVFLFQTSLLASTTPASSGPWQASQQQLAVLEDVQHDTFKFFWKTTNPSNGLTPDRYPNTEFASIAGVGFALSAYIVGVEKEYVTRPEAAERTLTTLKFLYDAPQSAAERNISGHKGYFYHFLYMDNGYRHRQTELSSIDTALLMAGVLSAMSYFDGDSPAESRIRDLADKLYRRVEWPWLYSQEHKPLLSMGWRPEKGLVPAYWRGYNEGMILYILALGSPTHPIDAAAWKKWTATYEWQDHYNYPHVNFGPLFGHQYSHVWIDFREIQDTYMGDKGIDYFINSRRATYSAQAYCIANPHDWKGYDERSWGLTACNGPAAAIIHNDNKPRSFYRYLARGTSAQYLRDDGTIAPTAAGGSIPFAPEITIPTLEHFRNQFGDRIYGEYGFKDAFNLSYPHAPEGWFDDQYLAIDQGPILLMIENYQTQLIWDLMKKNPYIRKGLERAGFSGGWLSPQQAGITSALN